MWIHFSDDDNSILLLKGIMKVKHSLVVQLGKQLHLSQSGCLLLGPRGNKLCSVLHLVCLLGRTFHIGKSTSGETVNQFHNFLLVEKRLSNNSARQLWDLFLKPIYLPISLWMS